MLNYIWVALIVISVIVGAINGRIPQVVQSVTVSASAAVTLSLGLIGILSFWLGLMKIAEEGGLMQFLARCMRPLMVRLFPDVPSNHPAMGLILLSLVANMLGLGNAATPFGLKAMQELETLNSEPGTATNAMCMLLALHTSGIQFVPTTAIAFLVAAGARAPTQIIVSSLGASVCATIAAIVVVKLCEKRVFVLGRVRSCTP